MDHVGKIVGGVAGLLTGRWWLAALGILLGYQFDRGFAQRYRTFRTQDSGIRTLPEGYVRILFQVIGHLSKADGRVTEEEIRAARRLMNRLNMTQEQIQSAAGWFDEGKSAGYPLAASLRTLRARYARQSESQMLFVRLLMEVSLSKGGIAATERKLMRQICRELGISRIEQAQIEAIFRAQQRFRSSPAGGADSEKIRAAYERLGVSPTDTNEDIKKAYRRLMNRHHPDKIVGTNPAPAAVEEAKRVTREVRAAYELLKTRRAIR